MKYQPDFQNIAMELWTITKANRYMFQNKALIVFLATVPWEHTAKFTRII